MAKKELTAKELYLKNQKKAKFLKVLAPVCFWGFLTLAVLCLIFAIRSSFGNVAEILNLLDDKKYNGEALSTNYNYLIGKYGEWVIGNGGAGFQVKFVNIAHAVFSVMMITNLILFVVFLTCSLVLGKWLLPKISAHIVEENQDMVNMKVLEGAEKSK